mgnify:CR=1 FL=1
MISIRLNNSNYYNSTLSLSDIFLNHNLVLPHFQKTSNLSKDINLTEQARNLSKLRCVRFEEFQNNLVLNKENIRQKKFQLSVNKRR